MRSCALLQLFVHLASSAIVSNLELPTDDAGNLMLTGEACVLRSGGETLLYANVWGGCPGVDCCASSSGCASCCFAGPADPCVYTANHSVVVYKTTDFTSWTFLGVAQSPADRPRSGTEFRPQVVFSQARGEFIMW